MTNTLAFPVNVHAQVQQINLNWGEQLTLPQIKGPALIYVAWNGPTCGRFHNFKAIESAATKLGIPLYVINSSPMAAPGHNGPLIDKPGMQITPKDFNAVIDYVSNYNLTASDGRVRLIDRNGHVVGAKGIDVDSRYDIQSMLGEAAILQAFQGKVNEMRQKPSVVRVR